MSFDKIPLPEEVLYIIEKLNKSGYRADVVGGAVRDYLLGSIPDDYDITTSATPLEMKTVFSGERLIETGIKHGTVSVILHHKAYEITTYRIDGEYIDSRHPNTVYFTEDIGKDLARRDFTVNAMAYNPSSGITDLFGGREDLKKGIIRTVGKPSARFAEDALRILRALRFASRLDFSIEEGTERALLEGADRLSNISKERIYAEWTKLLCGEAAYKILARYPSVVRCIIPELDAFSLPDKEKFDSASPELRFISLFSDAGSDVWQRALYSLRSDVKIRKTGMLLLENLHAPCQNKAEIKLMMSKIGDENTEKLLQLRDLLSINRLDELSILREVLVLNEPYRLSDLKLGGDDLKRLGYSGSEIGEKLALLLRAVIFSECENEPGALVEYIKTKRT